MRKSICLLFCLCFFLAACSHDVPPATSPATQPTAATEPAVTVPVSADRYYRLCPDSASEELGLPADAWIVLYEDGTGMCKLQGAPEYLRWNDSQIWYSTQVLPYIPDGSKLICSSSGFDLTFTLSEGAPAATVDPKIPQELQWQLEGFWLGWCDLQTSYYSQYQGSPLMVEFVPAEDGRLQAFVSFAAHDGEDCTFAFFPTYNSNLDGLMLLGEYYEAPVLADSNCYLLGDDLYMTLQVGDPAASDAFTIEARLQLLGSMWENTEGDLVMPLDQVLHYSAMASEHVLTDFRSENGYTLDLYESYLVDYGWSLADAEDLTGSWTVLTYTIFDNQVAYFFLELYEDGSAEAQWLYLDDTQTREIYRGTWSSYMENRSFLQLELYQEGGGGIISDVYPVLITDEGNMLFMGTGSNEDSAKLIRPDAETMLTIWDRSVG